MIQNIKNVYYMLSYVYQKLSREGYKKMETEEFSNIQNLLASIIQNEVSVLIKGGLTQEYVSYEEMTSNPKGKIDFSKSIKTSSLQRHKAVCNYELYSEDNIFNQVIKETMLVLIRSRLVDADIKNSLKKLLLFFSNVSEIDCGSINWHALSSYRNFQSYRILINMCYMVTEGLLFTLKDGTYKLSEYLSPEKEYALFQKFVFSYFKKEHKDIVVKAPHIDWDLDTTPIPLYFNLLPQMETDMVLEFGGRTLIIDTKYYDKIFRGKNYSTKKSFISGNLYQIFSYVKNYDKAAGNRISGMLLYAQTDEVIEPDYTYEMSGNKISIESLNLNKDWALISQQLDTIAKNFKSGAI